MDTEQKAKVQTEVWFRTEVWVFDEFIAKGYIDDLDPVKFSLHFQHADRERMASTLKADVEGQYEEVEVCLQFAASIELVWRRFRKLVKQDKLMADDVRVRSACPQGRVKGPSVRTKDVVACIK